MNIQLKFLEKAIKDKNYVSFTYKGKKYDKIEASKINPENFDLNLIRSLIILKNKFI
jgi:hypothetical protein